LIGQCVAIGAQSDLLEKQRLVILSVVSGVVYVRNSKTEF